MPLPTTALFAAPKWWLHTLGLALTASRFAHPLGRRFDRMNDLLRIFGAGGTLVVSLAAVLTSGWQALR